MTHTCVVLFDSIHHVLAAERLLVQRDLPCDLVPVPKDLSADCGLAVETPCEVLVDEVLDSPRFRWRSVHRRLPEGWEKVWMR